MSLEDGSQVSLDAVVVNKIRAYQNPAYLVVRELYRPNDCIIVITDPSVLLGLGQTIDVQGTITTLASGDRAIVSPTVMGYTDESGKLLMHGPIKGMDEPIAWEWKTDLTVGMLRQDMEATVTTTDDSGLEPPSVTPSGPPTYYSSIGAVLNANPPLVDGALVEFQCKRIASTGTDATYGNYFVIGEDSGSDTLKVYCQRAVASTDRINLVTGQLRTEGTNRVLCVNSGPGYDPQIYVGRLHNAAQGTIGWAKTFADGTVLPVALVQKIVTSDFPYLHRLWIQELDRSAGIRVDADLGSGNKATITGAQITTIDNQRVLVVSPAGVTWQLDLDAAEPLLLTIRDVAGGAFNIYTPGATGVAGPHNVGLYVSVVGRAVSVTKSHLYVTDGSNLTGIKVDLSMGGEQYYVSSPPIHPGDVIRVDGIPVLETAGSDRIRVLKCFAINKIDDLPRFEEIKATPSRAGIDEVVEISFTVSEALQANPAVKVNDHPATFVSSETLSGTIHYAYTYTVTADDQPGAATISIVGTEAAFGHLSGSATDTDALWISNLTFDECGNRLTMRDSRGITGYEYDVLGRLIKVTEPDGRWIAYEYDLNNNRTKMTTHSDAPAFEHVTRYDYTDSNRLWEVTDQLGGVTEYTYEPNGLVDEIHYPNGTKADHNYNNRNWLTDLVNTKSDGTVIAGFHYEYTYDPTNGKWGRNGMRTAVVEEIRTPQGTTPQVIKARVDYTYDNRYQLTREHRYANGGDPGVAYDKQYVYDPAGNRTRMIVNGVATDYLYDAANKMLSAGTTTFTYDDAGNTLTGSDGTSYTWDYRNLMTQWAKGGNSVQYLYDGDGRRVGQVPSAGQAKYYLLDGKEVAEEITGVGVVSYIGPQYNLPCSIDGQTRAVYLTDGQGSTRATTAANQSVQVAVLYDGYGNTIASYPALSMPSFGYASASRYHLDSSGLYYLKARYYDPGIGRFTSRDPIGYKGGLNLFAYTENRPTVAVDPTGLQATIGAPPPTCSDRSKRYKCLGVDISAGASGLLVIGGAAGITALVCTDGCTVTLVVIGYTCSCGGLYFGAGAGVTGCVTDKLECLPGGNVANLPIGSIGFGDGFTCGTASVGRGVAVGVQFCDCSGKFLYKQQIR